MPLCGFNQKMLKGLFAFHEGLVEHGLIQRSKNKKCSINETLQNEISDMDRFMVEIDGISDPESKEIIKNLTLYAKSFYTLIGKNGIDNYEQLIASLNNLYFEMDNKYYSELEGNPEDMKKLVEHLNTIKI